MSTENLTAMKIAIVTAAGAVSAFLGWRLIMVLVWVFLMAVDYLSGTWAARQNGTWKSEMAREGLGHKGGMVLVVLVCMIADLVMMLVSEHLTYEVIPIEWPVVLFPIMTLWYIITEIGSIIENAIKMGAPIPTWLPKLLDATMKVVDAVGENAAADVLSDSAGASGADSTGIESLDAEQLRNLLERLGLSRTYTETLTREQLLMEMDKMADAV